MKRLVLLTLALCVAACATYREDLNRGQRLYEENEYEHALAIWRVLEEDMDSLSLNDQARYAYLRGMTDFRLGFRPDARHWLAIARAVEQEHPGGLSQQWKQRLDEALTDLNRDVYGGAESLTEPPTDTGAPPPVTDAGAASAACTTDADCPAGQSCLNGVCVAAPPAQ
jgi:Cys-rich repeat protein